jgi:HEPN domain-containing protein
MWLKQAESDLRKARNDLATRDWDSAAFWSQQAAEKALKALLLEAGLVYRGHDLLGMAELIERELGIQVDEIRSHLRELTIHYTVARYPNAANAVPSEIYDEAKARQLVSMAEQVVAWVKQRLR